MLIVLGETPGDRTPLLPISLSGLQLKHGCDVLNQQPGSANPTGHRHSIVDVLNNKSETGSAVREHLGFRIEPVGVPARMSGDFFLQ